MAKPLRIVLTTIKWLAAALVALVALFFAINSFDEDLRPEAIALATPPANPYAPDKNLYIALLGFHAADGESSVAVAERRIRANQELASELQRDPKHAAQLIERYAKPEGLGFAGKIDFCLLLSGSCWAEAELHAAEIATLRNSNRTLYQRYLDLPALPGYFETEGPHVLMLPAYPPSQLRRLFLADTALDVKRAAGIEKKQAALQRLRDDVETWRRMLIGEGTLISKMLAIVGLHSDYMFLGDMIADSSVELAPLSPAIDDILTRVGSEDWKMRDIFAFEYRVGESMMQQIRRNQPPLFGPLPEVDHEGTRWWEPYWGRLQWHFFKFNATDNSRAHLMIELQRAANSDPSNLLSAQKQVAAWIDQDFGFGPGMIYNPIGKLTVAISAPAYENYPLRVYDVAAYARAVRLAYEIRLQQIATTDVPAFSRQHTEWSTHPVSGEPFAWDPVAGRLTVPTMGKTSTDRRFDVPVSAASRAMR
jgi:hypothetical protein